MGQKQRGSRDTRDQAEDLNNDVRDHISVPFCPGCFEDSPWGTYPPGTSGVYWCSSCLRQRITELRGNS